MEALALRLSQLDSHAEGALRVVMFYDTLMRRRVDLAALARASAALAECMAGIRLHGTGQMIRMAPDGRQASTPPRRRTERSHSLWPLKTLAGPWHGAVSSPGRIQLFGGNCTPCRQS
jgi:hypothetical protein